VYVKMTPCDALVPQPGGGRALPLAPRARLTSCTMATERIDEVLSQLTLTALLGQYRECSAQHMHSYTLTWQVPAFTIGVSGVLVASTFGYDVPEVVRAIVSAVGAIFVLAMTVALERNRILQLHRRKDLIAIEDRLMAAGVDPLIWDFSKFLEEARSGAFPGSRFYVYRLVEFFGLLRDLMLLVVMLLVGLSGYWLVKALTG
jgi:hypothetical protein